MLAQHHPEYVALVWGAMRFILVVSPPNVCCCRFLTHLRLQGIINHERLVQEFGRAIIEIGDALPQVDLVAHLYQIDDMRDAIARLYTQIPRLLSRALTWYKSRGFEKPISVILSPNELRYKDIVNQIEACSRSVNRIVASKKLGRNSRNASHSHSNATNTSEVSKCLATRTAETSSHIREYIEAYIGCVYLASRCSVSPS